MLRTVLTSLGVLLLLVGALGFMRPHNVMPISLGVLAVYFGTEGSLPAARTFCRALGAGYALLGLLGYVLGRPGEFWLDGWRRDALAFKPLPGVLELGTLDHNIHLLLGITALSVGLFTRIRGPERSIAPDTALTPAGRGRGPR